MKDRGVLVVNRKIGQSFYIGTDIEIKLKAIRGTQAQFVIFAPKDVIIGRDLELHIKRLTESTDGQHNEKTF